MASEFSRSYYWRAVRSIARETGQTIKEARRGDWQSYAQAEKDRRSAASQKAWETRYEQERQKKRDRWDDGYTGEDWVVEEPIDTVGGKQYP